MASLTTARQARLIKCAIMSPGLELRARGDDADQLRQFGLDITSFVQKIDLYESIFDNTMSGTINLLENVGLPEYLPIVGVEVLVIIFEIDNPTLGKEPLRFKKAFRVLGLKNQTYPRHDFRMYTLALATAEYVTSLSSRVRRAFHNKTCSEGVKTICEHYLGIKPHDQLDVEDTSDQIDIVMPNYTPLMAINYFATLARTTNKECNYLFFETLAEATKKPFHFVSIAKLIQDASSIALEDLPLVEFNAGASTAETNFESDLQDFGLRVHQDQTFNLLTDIASGMLRSRLIHFDFLAQKIQHEEDSRYTETFKNTTHLDKFPVYPKNFDRSVDKDVRIFMVPSNSFSSKSKHADTNSVEQQMHEAVVLRNRQLREIRHIQTLIDVPGSPTLRAGSVINVRYPSTRVLQDVLNRTINERIAEEPTPLYSGRHLVTAVHHILVVKGPGAIEYRMNIKVNRDSLGSRLIGSDNEDDLQVN